MPFIRISVAGKEPNPYQITQLQRKTTQLMSEVLKKRSEVTVVTVESSHASHWSVDGKHLEGDQVLVQMEAFITAGTNSEQEKAEFILAAHQMLCSVFDAAISPLYVVIIEVEGESWGYGGKTQSARRLAAQIL